MSNLIKPVTRPKLLGTQDSSALAASSCLSWLGLGSTSCCLTGLTRLGSNLNLLGLLFILGLLDPLLDLTQGGFPGGRSHFGLLGPFLLDHLQRSSHNGARVGLVGGPALLLDSFRMNVLFMLLPEQSSPCELRGLQSIVKVPLALAIQEQKHLWITSYKPDPPARIDLGATETADLRLEHHLVAAVARLPPASKPSAGQPAAPPLHERDRRWFPSPYSVGLQTLTFPSPYSLALQTLAFPYPYSLPLPNPSFIYCSHPSTVLAHFSCVISIPDRSVPTKWHRCQVTNQISLFLGWLYIAIKKY